MTESRTVRRSRIGDHGKADLRVVHELLLKVRKEAAGPRPDPTSDDIRTDLMNRLRKNNQTGFTLVELLIGITIMSVVGLIANTSYRDFRQRTILNRAAQVVAADAALTRTYAIRERGNVSLVADEANQRYEIRDAAGNVLKTRWFDGDSDLPLGSLNVVASGDSLTFNARGMLVSAFALVVVGTDRGSKTVIVNGLGRHQIIRN
jgi:prepilin-type N-terminal cleavage/methylation domain-containing protein